MISFRKICHLLVIGRMKITYHYPWISVPLCTMGQKILVSRIKSIELPFVTAWNVLISECSERVTSVTTNTLMACVCEHRGFAAWSLDCFLQSDDNSSFGSSQHTSYLYWTMLQLYGALSKLVSLINLRKYNAVLRDAYSLFLRLLMMIDYEKLAWFLCTLKDL